MLLPSFFQSNLHPSKLKKWDVTSHKHSHPRRKTNKMQNYFTMKAVHSVPRSCVSTQSLSVSFSELQIHLACQTIHYSLNKKTLTKEGWPSKMRIVFDPWSRRKLRTASTPHQVTSVVSWVSFAEFLQAAWLIQKTKRGFSYPAPPQALPGTGKPGWTLSMQLIKSPPKRTMQASWGLTTPTALALLLLRTHGTLPARPPGWQRGSQGHSGKMGCARHKKKSPCSLPDNAKRSNSNEPLNCRSISLLRVFAWAKLSKNQAVSLVKLR